ncbi:hypothetical protein AURDEDRAFT_127664 [Auricularia subglabra TFB-10046 SS5]|nr:hypothetical protein AURDEDRAFT_127664 [Auricularia subglabra TFB-10046 SS5]
MYNCVGGAPAGKREDGLAHDGALGTELWAPFSSPGGSFTSARDLPCLGAMGRGPDTRVRRSRPQLGAAFIAFDGADSPVDCGMPPWSAMRVDRGFSSSHGSRIPGRGACHGHRELWDGPGIHGWAFARRGEGLRVQYHTESYNRKGMVIAGGLESSGWCKAVCW